MRIVLIIDWCFQLLLRNGGLFSVSMLSWWAGVQELGGSTAKQLTQAGQRKYSIPETSCSFYKLGLTRGQELSFSRSLNVSASSVFFPRVWWVLQNSRVWHNLWNSWALGNPQVLRLLLRNCLCNWFIKWWENCIVYSLLCIFISSSSSINISFVILLNCFYLNPQVLVLFYFFFSFSSPSHCRGKEQVSRSMVPVAGCQDKTRHLPTLDALFLYTLPR